MSKMFATLLAGIFAVATVTPVFAADKMEGKGEAKADAKATDGKKGDTKATDGKKGDAKAAAKKADK